VNAGQAYRARRCSMVKAFSASHRASKVCCTESISIQATDSRFSSAVNPDGGGVVDVDVDDGTTNESGAVNPVHSIPYRFSTASFSSKWYKMYNKSKRRIQGEPTIGVHSPMCVLHLGDSHSRASRQNQTQESPRCNSIRNMQL
jgi:hypothetical protein